MRFFLPGGINDIFRYLPQYDLAFGEAFYNYSWHSGIPHRQLMGEISCPHGVSPLQRCLHGGWNTSGCRLRSAGPAGGRFDEELPLGNDLLPHNIHRAHSKQFLQAMEQLSSMLLRGRNSCIQEVF